MQAPTDAQGNSLLGQPLLDANRQPILGANSQPLDFAANVNPSTLSVEARRAYMEAFLTDVLNARQPTYQRNLMTHYNAFLASGTVSLPQAPRPTAP